MRRPTRRVLALVAVAAGCTSSDDATPPGFAPSADVTGTWQGPDTLTCPAAPERRPVTQRLVLRQSGAGVRGSVQHSASCGGAPPAATDIRGGQVIGDVAGIVITDTSLMYGKVSASAIAGTLWVKPPTSADYRAVPYVFTRVP